MTSSVPAAELPPEVREDMIHLAKKLDELFGGWLLRGVSFRLELQYDGEGKPRYVTPSVRLPAGGTRRR